MPARSSATSRDSAGNRRGAPVAVSLREVVASVDRVAAAQVRRKATFVLDVQGDSAPAVLAVFEELQQVVLNFVINAEQAVRRSSRHREGSRST